MRRRNQASHFARRIATKLVLFAALAVARLAACGSAEDADSAQEGGIALWHLDSSDAPTSDSDSFTALVHRVGCGNGETGEVLEPLIVEGRDEILVTFTVEALPANEGFDCRGNNRVPYDIELGEPIGDRALVDGTCRSIDLTPGNCNLDGLRWTPDRGAISEGADE